MRAHVKFSRRVWRDEVFNSYFPSNLFRPFGLDLPVDIVMTRVIVFCCCFVLRHVALDLKVDVPMTQVASLVYYHYLLLLLSPPVALNLSVCVVIFDLPIDDVEMNRTK